MKRILATLILGTLLFTSCKKDEEDFQFNDFFDAIYIVQDKVKEVEGTFEYIECEEQEPSEPEWWIEE